MISAILNPRAELARYAQRNESFVLVVRFAPAWWNIKGRALC